MNNEFKLEKSSKLFQVYIKYFIYKMTPQLYWENLDNLMRSPNVNHFFELVEEFYSDLIKN